VPAGTPPHLPLVIVLVRKIESETVYREERELVKGEKNLGVKIERECIGGVVGQHTHPYAPARASPLQPRGRVYHCVHRGVLNITLRARRRATASADPYDAESAAPPLLPTQQAIGARILRAAALLLGVGLLTRGALRLLGA
jgi:hypothetical protein